MTWSDEAKTPIFKYEIVCGWDKITTITTDRYSPAVASQSLFLPNTSNILRSQHVYPKRFLSCCPPSLFHSPEISWIPQSASSSRYGYKTSMQNSSLNFLESCNQNIVREIRMLLLITYVCLLYRKIMKYLGELAIPQ